MWQGSYSDVNNTITFHDAEEPWQPYTPLPGPQIYLYGNQYDGGQPLDNLQNAVHRKYTPDPMALVMGVPNLGAPGRGLPLLWPFSEIGLDGALPPFTNFSDWLSFSNASRLIVFVDDLGYQGVSPMELQPQLDQPEPWDVWTPKQRAGG